MAYTQDQIGGFYKQYLGRDLQNAGEAQGWLDNPNAESMIKNSGEAQAFSKNGAASTPWSGVAQPAPAQPRPGATAGSSSGSWNPQTGSYASSGTTPQYTDIQAKSAPATYNVGPADPHVAQTVAQIIQSKGLQANQSDPVGSMGPLVEELRKQGINAQVDYTDVNGHSGGILVDGKPYQLINGSNQWTQLQPWEDSSGGGGAGGGGGSSSFSSSSGGYGSNAQKDALYNTLMGRASQSINVNANDPNIRSQADPYAANTERERRRYMGDTAERMGPLANLQGEERLSSEKAGQANGLFESQLIGREMQSRRDEIAQALASMQGMLSQDQQIAMQRELAQLDASIRNRQISSGNDQFMANLGLQSENQNNYWDSVRSGLQ